MRNIVSPAAPGGTLVVGACAVASVGGSAAISTFAMHRRAAHAVAFDCAGFDRCSHVIEVAAVPDQASNGFEAILLASAQGPRATWPWE
jgi:hypothetical protein